MKVVKNNDSQNIEMYRRIENKLPSDWCVESIRNICDLQNGMAFKPDEKNDQGIGLPVVRIQNLNGSNKYDYYDKSVREQFLIKSGDVLFAWSGTTLGGYLWNGGDAILNQHIFKIVPKNGINNQWLYYLFKTIITKRANNDSHGGGGLVHVNKGTFEEYLIPSPSEEEQEKIANFLSERESYLQSIQTLISKMEQRNQYYFDKIFLGDYEIVDEKVLFIDNSEKQEISLNKKNIEINSRFSKKKIPEMVSLNKGGSVKKEDFNYEGSGTRYLRTSDVWEDSSSTKDAVYYEGNNKGLVYKTKKDWIVCFDGYNKKPKKGTLGLVTNQGEGYCSGELHIVKGVDGISMEFVNIALLRSSYFQDLICRYGEETTVKHAGKHVKTIELPYIPYEDQVVLNSKIKDMLNEVDLLKQLYSKEKQVFQWLCEKLVSGEYRIEE